MSVKRYECGMTCAPKEYQSPEMYQDAGGGYVSYEDYAAIEARCAALAAENAGLKELIEQHANSVAVCPNCSHEEPSETDDIVALYHSMETPTTEAFLAEVRAQHGESICASLFEKANEYDARAKEVDCHTTDNRYRFAAAMFRGFAAQLRKGVQS